MAEATRVPDETEVIVVKEGGVTLDLTLSEAQMLRDVLAYASGQETWAVYKALGNAGIERGAFDITVEGSTIRTEKNPHA